MRNIFLLAFLGLVAVSCSGHGPEVDVCLSFPEKGGFVCVDRSQKPYFLAYAESSKYVAFSPSDAQALIEACGISGKQRAMVTSYMRTIERVAVSTR